VYGSGSRSYHTQTMLCAIDGTISGKGKCGSGIGGIGGIGGSAASTPADTARAARTSAPAPTTTNPTTTDIAMGDDVSVDMDEPPTFGAPRVVMLCGSASGHLYAFHNNAVVEQVQVCVSPIYALCAAGRQFLAACKDGQVLLLGPDLIPLFAFNASKYSPKVGVICQYVICHCHRIR
jgi:hypothetical protein